MGAITGNYLRSLIFRFSKGIFENRPLSDPGLTFSSISIRNLSANPLISKLKNKLKAIQFPRFKKQCMAEFGS
jgi:hypothetical protein